MVVPEEHPAVYYQFTVKAFGWYNVDILLKGLPGVENSELIVRIQGEYREAVTVLLVIPSMKALCDGGRLKGVSDAFGFYTDDGKIPLPQGAQAYVIAMGEYKDQVIFGKVDFVAGLKQSLLLEPRLMKKEQMNAAVAALSIGGLSVHVQDTKNADRIKATDGELAAIEGLKPKNCDCNCGELVSDSSFVR